MLSQNHSWNGLTRPARINDNLPPAAAGSPELRCRVDSQPGTLAALRTRPRHERRPRGGQVGLRRPRPERAGMGSGLRAGGRGGGGGEEAPSGCIPSPGTAGTPGPGGGSDWPSPGVSGGVREEFQSRAWAGNERAGESGARAPAVMQGRAAAYLSAQRRKESGTRNTATLLAFSAPAALASGFGVAERGQRRVRGALWKVVVDRHC